MDTIDSGLFDMLGDPALSSDEFVEEIDRRYDGESMDGKIGAAVDNIWPVVTDRNEPPTILPRREVDESDVAPTVHADTDSYEWFPAYRAHQRDAVISVLSNLYVDDKTVVTLSAPTGAGKSLILYAAIEVLSEEFGRKSFFTTPLNALIDQIKDDEFVEDQIITLKGKSNYSCVHQQDAGTPVNSAICQRDSTFECEHKQRHHEMGGCPYYGRKYAGQNHAEFVTNLSYLMANSMIPDTVESKFQPRELVVIDECQSIEDFALGFVSVVVSQRTVPIVWDEIDLPPDTENVEQLADRLQEEVIPPVRQKLNEFEDRISELSEEEVEQQEDLQDFFRKCNNLVNDVRENHWVANVEGHSLQSSNTVSSNEVANREIDDDDGDWKVEFKPIYVGRFLDRFLWSQGHKVILSSATIPKGGFLEEIGLDNETVGRVEVPSTFPTDRRPVYTDQAVGKMTMRERDRTIPQMADKIAEIADHHWENGNHRGFVHCHSYKIADRLYKALPLGVRERTRVQDGDNREDSLEAWLDAPVDETGLVGGYDKYNDDGRNKGGQIFLSVAMDEGISLDDWRARWQVIAKCAYPYLGPEAKRANYRLDELDDWTWYAGSAAINLQQAVGRGMRSKDDWCHTYVLDESAVGLISKNEYLFEDWFLDAIGESPSDDIPDRYGQSFF